MIASLYFLGNTFQSSSNLLLKDKFNNYNNLSIKSADKKTLNTLDEIVKSDSSFYSENIIIPKYQIKNENCSKYAVLSAKKLFNKNYNPENSWNLRYSNKIISWIKDKEELISLAEDTILKPGMIVGFDNPNSRYKNKTDFRGKKAEYTHVALYLGKNGKNLQFAHQFGEKIEKINLDELIDKKLILKEVLDSEKN